MLRSQILITRYLIRDKGNKYTCSKGPNKTDNRELVPLSRPCSNKPLLTV